MRIIIFILVVFFYGNLNARFYPEWQENKTIKIYKDGQVYDEINKISENKFFNDVSYTIGTGEDGILLISGFGAEPLVYWLYLPNKKDIIKLLSVTNFIDDNILLLKNKKKVIIGIRDIKQNTKTYIVNLYSNYDKNELKGINIMENKSFNRISDNEKKIYIFNYNPLRLSFYNIEKSKIDKFINIQDIDNQPNLPKKIRAFVGKHLLIQAYNKNQEENHYFIYDIDKSTNISTIKLSKKERIKLLENTNGSYLMCMKNNGVVDNIRVFDALSGKLIKKIILKPGIYNDFNIKDNQIRIDNKIKMIIKNNKFDVDMINE